MPTNYKLATVRSVETDIVDCSFERFGRICPTLLLLLCRTDINRPLNDSYSKFYYYMSVRGTVVHRSDTKVVSMVFVFYI